MVWASDSTLDAEQMRQLGDNRVHEFTAVIREDDTGWSEYRNVIEQMEGDLISSLGLDSVCASIFAGGVHNCEKAFVAVRREREAKNEVDVDAVEELRCRRQKASRWCYRCSVIRFGAKARDACRNIGADLLFHGGPGIVASDASIGRFRSKVSQQVCTLHNVDACSHSWNEDMHGEWCDQRTWARGAGQRSGPCCGRTRMGQKMTRGGDVAQG